MAGEEEVSARSRFRMPPRRFVWRRVFPVLLALFAVVFAAGGAVLAHYYFKFAVLIDRRLAAGPFSDTTDIFSAPRLIAEGDPATPAEIVERLRRAGFTTARGNPLGWYNVRQDAVDIFPGRDSYPGEEPAVLEFQSGKVSRIISLDDNTERGEYELAPQLIANISDRREKRRLVHFSDVPPCLLHAVISAEDKHFFHHSGFDMLRIVKAAWVDLKEGRKEQGASTLTMQLARGVWLDPAKSWRRKIEELLMTVHLEHKLTKQQIFEYYANEVYLGRRGSYSIGGFGEGARAFFDKDLSHLTNAEAALLAGLVQRPSYYNPFRYPDRARERRDVVLSLMRQNGYLTAGEFQDAVNSPVTLAPEHSGGVDTQYFLDLASDEVQSRLDDREKQIRYIYTTLDPALQNAAEAAVRAGMESVDRRLRKRKRKNAAPIPAGQPQVALVAIDPHTGEIKALVGGRNYAASQLNRALAMRQPGSAFKPFVYAAALNTAIKGGPQIFTPASIVDDAPTAFEFDDQLYRPGNFRHEFMGEVTLRTALAHSLNNAAVDVAQEVGYAKVAALAHSAGLYGVEPTPSAALGAYETSPLELAGAYTIFANHGLHVAPTAVSLVRGRTGKILYRNRADARQALDPRVAYLIVNMMEEVLRTGTGAGARSLGFKLPAAGKTGTTRDGWFAGFTSQLLTVVWVGFDDNRDLDLEGAHSALPIWADFMKRAAALRPYRDATGFDPPPGIVSVEICAASGQLAGPNCPKVYSESFIDGTQPVIQCELHSPPPAPVAEGPASFPSPVPLAVQPPAAGR